MAEHWVKCRGCGEKCKASTLYDGLCQDCWIKAVKAEEAEIAERESLDDVEPGE